MCSVVYALDLYSCMYMYEVITVKIIKGYQITIVECTVYVIILVYVTSVYNPILSLSYALKGAHSTTKCVVTTLQKLYVVLYYTYNQKFNSLLIYKKVSIQNTEIATV